MGLYGSTATVLIGSAVLVRFSCAASSVHLPPTGKVLEEYGFTVEHVASCAKILNKGAEAGDKVLTSQLSLDCRARRSG